MYDVALSFAGEDRPLAARIAELCRSVGMSVFYDDFEKASLWGKDLAIHLDTVYRKDARYCIVIISEAYVRKKWTRHEVKAVLARAVENPDDDYLLPVRIDDTDVPGLSNSVAFLDARVTTPEEMVQLLGEKIGARSGPGFERVAAQALVDAAKSAALTPVVLDSPGEMLFGRYRLDRLIASGGMGELWEATDTDIGRHVAVKLLRSEFSSDPEFTRRFRAEARTVALLNHPCIAAVHGYGETEMQGRGRLAYLITELVHGHSLNTIDSRIDVQRAVNILEQAGRALGEAHNFGLVHGDVKPANILLTDTGQVKVTDFAIAKAFNADLANQTGALMDTAYYFAPERTLGGNAAPASDVYSLGVIAYEMMAGEHPFTGDGAVAVARQHTLADVPPLPTAIMPPMRELIAIATARDPSRRFRDGHAFANAAANVRSGRSPLPADD